MHVGGCLNVLVLVGLTFTVYLPSFSYVKVFESIKNKVKICEATLGEKNCN